MDFTNFSALPDFIASPAPAPAVPAPPVQGNSILAGIKSGAESLGAGGLGALAAGAKAVGLDRVAQDIGEHARNLTDMASQAAQGYDTQGWFGNGVGGFAGKLGYSIGSFLPTLAGVALAAPVVPEIAAARVAGALGGAGLIGGEAGVAGALGGAGIMVPQAVGSIYNTANKNGTATQADALKSIAMGLPVGLAQSIVPGSGAAALAGREAAESLVSRVASEGFKNAAAGAVGSGLQTAAETSFDPNMSAGDRAKAIVDSAVQGGALGGLLGGAFGLLPGHSNADLAKAVDQGLQQDPTMAANRLIEQNATTPPSAPGGYLRGELPQPPLSPLGGGVESLPVAQFHPEPQQTAFDLRAPFSSLEAGAQPGLFQEPGAIEGAQPVPGAEFVPTRGMTGNLTPDRTPAFIPPAQRELPLAAPFESLPEGAQGNLFFAHAADMGAEPAPARPQDITRIGDQMPDFTALAREAQANEASKQIIAAKPAKLSPEAEAQLTAALAPAEPEAAPVRPDGSRLDGSTPAAILPSMLDEAGVKVGSRGALRDFVDSSKAATPDDLRQEMLDAIDAGTAPIKNPSFGKLAEAVGLIKSSDEAPHREQLKALADQRAADRTNVQDLGPTSGVGDRLDAGGKSGEQPVGAVEGATAEPVESGPRSIADRVVETARALTGETGGEVSIAEIRKALPDIAASDLDNALRQVHSDASDNELTKAPAGKRAGTDGVSVEGQGRFHNLHVEPREDAKPADVPVSNDTNARIEAEPIEATEASPSNRDRVQEALASHDSVTEAREALPDIPKREFYEHVQALRDDTDQTQAEQPQGDIASQRAAYEAARASVDQIRAENAVGAQPADLASRDDIKFKLASDNAQAKTAFDNTPELGFDVQQAFKDITAKIAPQLRDRIKLVNGVDDLPPELRADALRRATEGDTEAQGYYSNAGVHLRADMIPSRQALEDVMSHEVFGHAATAARLGDNYVSQLSSVFDRAGGIDGLKALAQKLKVWEPYGDSAGLKAYVPEDTRNLSAMQKATLADELIAHAAEGGNNPRAQRALLTFTAQVKAVIAKVLRTAGLDSFAKRFEGFGAAEVSKWLSDNRAVAEARENAPPQKNAIDLASLGDRARFVGQGLGEAANRPRLVRDQNEDYGAASRIAAGVANLVDKAKLNPLDLKRGAGKSYALIRSGLGMVRAWGSKVDGLKEHYELGHAHQTVEARIAQYHNGVNRDLGNFIRVYKNAGKSLMDLMNEASLYRLDPTKSWGEHTWLMDAENADLLKQKHSELQSTYNKLGQNFDGSNGQGQQLYHSVLANSEADFYINQIKTLENAVSTLAKGRDVAGFEASTVDGYLTRNDLHNDAFGTRDFFKAEYERKVAGLQADLVNAQTVPELKGSQTVEALGELLKASQDAHDIQMKAPYVHLGRSGDFFVSFRVKSNDADTAADPQAISAIQQKLSDAGFTNLAFNAIGDNRNAFVRVQTLDAAARLHSAVSALDEHLDPTKEIRSGLVNSDKFDASVIPALKKILDAVQESFPARTSDEEQVRDRMVNELKASMLDAAPLLNLNRIMVRREGVQGFANSLLENKVYHDQVVARSIASLQTRTRQAELAANMLRQVRDAQLTNPREAVAMHDMVHAYLDRAAAAQVRVTRSFMDTLRGATHSFYLGASPGYMIMQLSQVGTLAWPEFAKNHGYAGSFKAMTAGYGDMAKVLAAVVRSGELVNGGITPEVLARAGVSKDMADHLLALTNGGHMEMSSFSRAMQGDALSRNKYVKTGSKALAYANATATLSELAARLVTASAAKRLYDAKPVRGFASAEEYAAHTLSESMFNWGSYDTPKLMTAGGPFGRVGPLMFQFHQFATKLFEKVTHEAYNGFVARGENAAEARRFIYGHMAAVIALAGTLGLPAAGWGAAAVNRLTGLFNEGQGYDLQAHYRNFLASVFGKDVGEIIARGLPHYLGADLSDLGDKDFLPFTQLLEDHQKFKDAVGTYLAQAWGSNVSTIVNIAAAAQDFYHGNITEGLSRGLPVSARNLVRAYRLTKYGYLDSEGRKMPITADAADVIRQALGVQNSNYAEAQDRQETVRNAQEDRQQRSALIKLQIAKAFETGDVAGQRKWLAEARAFDLDPMNRGQPLSTGIQSYLAARQKAMAYSRATGNPLGASPRDLPALSLVRY